MPACSSSKRSRLILTPWLYRSAQAVLEAGRHSLTSFLLGRMDGSVLLDTERIVHWVQAGQVSHYLGANALTLRRLHFGRAGNNPATGPTLLGSLGGNGRRRSARRGDGDWLDYTYPAATTRRPVAVSGRRAPLPRSVFSLWC